ncbi:MAG: hypothetical protein ACM3H9_04975, partial [Rhodospirillaceae bacterium]
MLGSAVALCVALTSTACSQPAAPTPQQTTVDSVVAPPPAPDLPPGPPFANLVVERFLLVRFPDGS